MTNGTTVEAHAADAFGRPVRVAAEQRVVIGRAQETHNAQLLHQLVPQFLGARFVQDALAQIPLDIDVEEGRDAADRHRRTVGLLHGAEIGQIGPLHCFMGIGCRARDVAIVELAHRREILKRSDLLRELLALSNDFVGRPHVVDLGTLCMLRFKQAGRRHRARRGGSRR